MSEAAAAPAAEAATSRAPKQKQVSDRTKAERRLGEVRTQDAEERTGESIQEMRQ